MKFSKKSILIPFFISSSFILADFYNDIPYIVGTSYLDQQTPQPIVQLSPPAETNGNIQIIHQP